MAKRSKIVKNEQGKEVFFERFDDYWKGSPKGVPAIKKLHVRFVPDLATAVTELLAQRADWIWNINPDQANDINKMPFLQAVRQESMRVGYLSIDAAGCFCEKLPGGFVRHMSVVYSDPGALKMFGGLGPLQTTGAAGHLGFEVAKAADPAKSVLTLTYNVGGYAKGGLAETWAAPVDFVLGAQAARLKKYIETGKPD